MPQHMFGPALSPAETLEMGNIVNAANGFSHRLMTEWFAFARLEARLGQAIWHSHQSDRAQRDMVLATLEATDYPERGRREIKWICEQVDKLARFRNNAVHTVFTTWGPIGGEVRTNPDPTAPPKSKILWDQPLEQLFFECAEHYWRMDQYLAFTTESVFRNEEFRERPTFPQLLQNALSSPPMPHYAD